MKELKELIEIVDRLLGPDGCPWDKQQTLRSARKYPLEEASELIDAIDKGDPEHIKEELGDLFFNAVFLSKLAEQEHRFNLAEVVSGINEKLIRRHPHVFSDLKIEHAEEVVKQWEKIKKDEKKSAGALESIPKSLSSLARAAKVLKRMDKAGFVYTSQKNFSFNSEDQLGDLLLQIVHQASDQGIDAEHALRKALGTKEREFINWETSGK